MTTLLRQLGSMGFWEGLRVLWVPLQKLSPQTFFKLRIYKILKTFNSRYEFLQLMTYCFLSVCVYVCVCLEHISMHAFQKMYHIAYIYEKYTKTLNLSYQSPITWMKEIWKISSSTRKCRSTDKHAQWCLFYLFLILWRCDILVS